MSHIHEFTGPVELAAVKETVTVSSQLKAADVGAEMSAATGVSGSVVTSEDPQPTWGKRNQCESRPRGSSLPGRRPEYDRQHAVRAPVDPCGRCDS